MSIPAFSAQASLYRTSNRYRSSGAEFGGLIADQSVVAAYIPGPETQNKCSGCEDGCAVARNICLTKVGVTAFETCAGTGIAFPICAAAVIEFLTPGCYEAYSVCLGYCNIPGGLGPFSGPCCPQVCGPPDPLRGSGTGCCDHGETCVDENDPNSREGCCPVGQFCDGKCCAQGCCAGTCCGPGDHCCGNACCPPDVPCGTDGFCAGFGHGPPPPPPPFSCAPGGVPCGLPDNTGVIRTCCPPGLQCCSYSAEFGPDCRTSCIH